MPAKRTSPKLSSVDLNLLLALDALVREGNVTAAGRRIGLSQPAMSHALSRLREVLGDPLLVREGRVMRLTSLAERLAPRVQRLIGEIDATLLGHQAFEPETATRTFRIATNDYCSAVLMPPLLARVRRLAPGVELELHAHKGRAPAAELARGELDLAVGTFLESESALERQVLLRETFACLVRRGHPRAKGKLSVQDYAALDHVLITAPDYGAGVVDFALAEQGLRRRVVARTPHFLVAPALVAATDAVVTLPSRLARFSAGPGLRSFAPPLPLPPFDVHVLWHSAASKDAASLWLREQVLAVARALPASH
ncbi:MAG: LysR family transcriptional regulator [Myxococcales bacterium]|nr:MAG: LysR family transcriptional regulator [Myxococcales bacterium]